MPDKQNENRFMAMLERRGMIRKAGTEDELKEEVPDNANDRERAEADLRSMFNQPAGDTILPSPAARQPVPGIITPANVAERSHQLEREQQKPAAHAGQAQSIPVVRMQGEQVRPVGYVGPDPSRPTGRVESEPPRPSGRVEFESAKRVDITKPAPFFNGTDYTDEIPMREHLAQTSGTFAPAAYPSSGSPVAYPSSGSPAAYPSPGSSAAYPSSDAAAVHPSQSLHTAHAASFTPGAPVTPPPYDRPPEPPPIENYTARYLDIEELYEALSLRSKRTDTIYLIEEYLKTLPESLPDESRREIVSKIVAASGFDFDLLIGDGVLRVKMLKEYAERFAKYTDDFVSARNTEVDELEQQIMRIRRQIENRRDLHKKQFFAIEAEAQRLKDILTFISG